jgi:prolipoprotein diacylglyceryl transferase
MLHDYLPSPTRSVWYLGPLPVRAYALCIIVGVIVAIWLGDRRWRARGGRAGQVADIAIWAVPFGLVGGRVYHVITDAEIYFTEPGHDWVNMFKIWDGGLGIPGAIALGAVGAWIGARRSGVKLPPLADAVAPGIVLAQGLGRWGNWFNNELYGRATTQPWGLTIHCLDNRAATICPGTGSTVLGHFQPTFLYESVWDIGVALLVIWLDRRLRLGHGRAFALYLAAYTAGRYWIEDLRIDYAHRFFGLRLNDWTSILVFVGAVVYIVVSARLRPGRETPDEVFRTPPPDDAPAADALEEPHETGVS